MGELKEWGKAIGNLIRSGGITTSDPKSKSSRTNDDDSDYDYRDSHGYDAPDDDD